MNTFKKILNYLPLYWHPNLEMIEILKTAADELDELRASMQIIYTDAFILTASEKRIAEWEQNLYIQPTGTLEQRRLYILSKLRGSGKLNEAKIKNIVSAFTEGGGSIVTFANSTINIKVLPPNNGEIFLFPDIIRSIKPRKPAHIDLVVERYYSTWNDIKTQFINWQDLYDNKADWAAVKNHIER